MVNYNKSSIYKLCCKDINIKEEYVGSTTRFERRKAEHKYRCKSSDNNCYAYQFINENGGIDNWDMIQIEEVNVNNRRELETRERYWIEFLKAELNCNIPSRTKKDIAKSQRKYYKNNIEVIAEKAKEYRKNNIEVIKESQKKYRENNIDVFLKKEKEYRENNREVIAEKRKEHVESKKEYDKERRLKNSEKIDCDCGSKISQNGLSKHKKTKKHLNFIDQSHEQI